MDYKEAYVHEVGQNLPEKTREDIQNEIRSLIEDALEDQSQKLGRPADEEMLLDVLRGLGSPQKMAASYLPPQYLIGPALYPAFVQTARIVLAVIAVLAMIGLGVSLGGQAYLPQQALEVAGQAAAGLFDAIFKALGMIVIIFAIIQRVNPNARFSEQSWDPRKMKAPSDADRVKIADPIASIIFTVIVLAVLNLYPQWLGFNSLVNGEWVHVGVMTEAFFRYLPWISLILTLQLTQNVLLLSQGRWTATVRWFAIAIAALNLMLGIVMLTGPSIVQLDPADIVRLGWGAPDANTIRTASRAFESSVRLVIGIVTALQVVEIAKQAFRLLNRRLPEVVANH